MNAKNTLLKEIENLPESVLAEVLDFVRFLEYKQHAGHEPRIQPQTTPNKERGDDPFFKFIETAAMSNKENLTDISENHDKYLY